MSPGCLRLLVAAGALIAASPAFAASCTPLSRPPANHPSLAALPDAYWRALPDWADMVPGDRDLLARVSIVQRDTRALDPKLHFSDEVPANVVALKTAPDQQFIADGAVKLDALVLAARAAGTSIYVSNGFRSYAVQRATWPRNLRKYLVRTQEELRPYRHGDGSYSDDAVCALRAYAAQHYAFPGYSNHQSGRAADFHAPMENAPELNSDSGADAFRGHSNIQRWCTSAVFAWLHSHAREFGFVQAKIDEPWHWVYDPPAAARPADADYVATSCQSVPMKP